MLTNSTLRAAVGNYQECQWLRLKRGKSKLSIYHRESHVENNFSMMPRKETGSKYNLTIISTRVHSTVPICFGSGFSLCGNYGGAGASGYKSPVLKHFSFFVEYILVDPDPVFPTQHKVKCPSLRFAKSCDC